MAVDLADPRIQGALNDDPEFLIMARQCNLDYAFGVGDRWFRYRIRDGKVASITAGLSIFDNSDVVFAGDEETWTKVLSPVPPPLHTDLWPTLLHGKMTMTGDVESAYAYWPMLRRVWDVVRELNIVEGK